jgi:hypothetical protein
MNPPDPNSDFNFFIGQHWLQCWGPGMFIPDPGSWFLTIPDLGSKNTHKRGGGEQNCCHTFFLATNFTKSKFILFLICWRKKFGPIFKEVWIFFTQKIDTKLPKVWAWVRDPGSEIRDPGSEFRDPGSEVRKPIPDPGVKKAPDPGSGSATLIDYWFISDNLNSTYITLVRLSFLAKRFL